MALHDDLTSSVQKIFREAWDTRDGYVVPEAEDLAFRNEGVKLKGTVLYADLSDSTGLVDSESPSFAAEVYKSYLYCAAKIISANDGEVTAYDGDRIMAVYIDDYKNTNAARSALKINYVVDKIINPALVNQYSTASFRIRHAIGIDTSSLLVARTGVRGSNDLVWVGRAANHAAKMSSINGTFKVWLSSEVYERMTDSSKLSQGNAMWTPRTWTSMGGRRIYGSNWIWKP